MAWISTHLSLIRRQVPCRNHWAWGVGGWTSQVEKYARQNGFIFPNFQGEDLKKLKKTPPRNLGLETKEHEKTPSTESFCSDVEVFGDKPKPTVQPFKR